MTSMILTQDFIRINILTELLCNIYSIIPCGDIHRILCCGDSNDCSLSNLERKDKKQPRKGKNLPSYWEIYLHALLITYITIGNNIYYIMQYTNICSNIMQLFTLYYYCKYCT